MDNKSLDQNFLQDNKFPTDEQFSNLLSDYSSYIEVVVSSFPQRHREDLVQEGLVALNSAYRTYDSSKNVPLDAYLKLCIKRRIIAAYRVLKKNDDTVDIEDNEISDPVDLENDIVEKKFTEDFILDLKQKLTELEKNVLFEYLLDKSYQQIAEKLDITEKTVDNTLVRIKNKVKKYFTE